MSSTKNWQRFNPDATAGHINWPTANQDWENTCEGGMTVYAAWAPADNPVHVCSPGLTIEAIVDETYLGSTGPDSADHDEASRDGFNVDAIILLGATGGSWANRAGEFWIASMDDVTPAGRAILDALSGLYGSQPTLLTLLDT